MKLKKGKNIIENIIWSITELYKFQKKYIGLFWFQAVISGILPIVSLVLIQQIINILQYKTADYPPVENGFPAHGLPLQ